MLRRNPSVTDSTRQFIDALACAPQDVVRRGEKLCRALGINDSWSEGARLHQAEAIYKTSKQQLGKGRAKGLRPPIFAAFGVSSAAIAKFEAKKDQGRVIKSLLSAWPGRVYGREYRSYPNYFSEGEMHSPNLPRVRRQLRALIYALGD